MEVYQIGGLGYDSNIYLINTEKPVLIDTGTGFNTSGTLKEIKRILKNNPIQIILLTHMHYDHVGGAKKIAETHKARVCAYGNDAEMLIRGDSTSTCARDFGNSLEKMNISLLSNDSIIDCGNAKLRVIHTPGHTSGSVSFYEPNTKSLFSGDTVFADGGVGRWDLATGDYSALSMSVSKLLKLGAAHLYPGHGPYIIDVAQEHIKMAMSNLQNDLL